jgi:hypothetical protein
VGVESDVDVPDGAAPRDEAAHSVGPLVRADGLARTTCRHARPVDGQDFVLATIDARAVFLAG